MDGKVLHSQFGFKPSTDDAVEKMVSKANPLPKEASQPKQIAGSFAHEVEPHKRFYTGK